MKNIIICLLFILIACNSFGQHVDWDILQGGVTFGYLSSG